MYEVLDFRVYIPPVTLIGIDLNYEKELKAIKYDHLPNTPNTLIQRIERIRKPGLFRVLAPSNKRKTADIGAIGNGIELEMGAHQKKRSPWVLPNKPYEAGPFWYDGGPLPVQLCFAPDEETWQYAWKAIECTEAPGPYPTSSGMCTVLPPTITNVSELVCIVTLNVGTNTTSEQIASLLAHEAVHVMQFLMRRMHPHNDVERHDEVEAYVIQWATQACLVAYNDYAAYKAGLKEKGKKKKLTA